MWRGEEAAWQLACARPIAPTISVHLPTHPFAYNPRPSHPHPPLTPPTHLRTAHGEEIIRPAMVENIKNRIRDRQPSASEEQQPQA